MLFTSSAWTWFAAIQPLVGLSVVTSTSTTVAGAQHARLIGACSLLAHQLHDSTRMTLCHLLAAIHMGDSMHCVDESTNPAHVGFVVGTLVCCIKWLSGWLHCCSWDCGFACRFDYGLEYIQQNLDGRCHCGTASCVSVQHSKTKSWCCDIGRWQATSVVIT